MDMTPGFWLLPALSASSIPTAETLLREIVAQSRTHLGTSRVSHAHAASVNGARYDPISAPTPIPLREHALAVSLLRAFPGVSDAESSVYQHIRDNPDMSDAEQESLRCLLGDGCPMMDYAHLGESLILGLVAEGSEAKHVAAAREVMIANALRDVRRQSHVIAMLAHTRLIGLLRDNRWLKHVKADPSVAHIRAAAGALRADLHQPMPDLRTQAILAEPLRDALLTFLLAEASV